MWACQYGPSWWCGHWEFLIIRRVLGLVVLGPAPDAKDVEIAVLHHQLLVLRRQVARPRYTPADRLLLATLARLLPRKRWTVFLVTPSTLLRCIVSWCAGIGSTRPRAGVIRAPWTRRSSRSWCAWPRKTGGGDTGVSLGSECRKLGITSATSVRTILRAHRLGPAPRRG